MANLPNTITPVKKEPSIPGSSPNMDILRTAIRNRVESIKAAPTPAAVTTPAVTTTAAPKDPYISAMEKRLAKSDELVSNLVSTLKDRPSATESYKRVSEELGIPEKQKVATGITRQLSSVDDMLTKLEKDISSRVSGRFTLNDAQRRRELSLEGRPLREQYAELLKQRSAAETGLTESRQTLQDILGAEKSDYEARIEAAKAPISGMQLTEQAYSDLAKYKTPEQTLKERMDLEKALAAEKLTAEEKMKQGGLGGYYESPDKPIQVSPGGTLVDPRTGEAIFTAPASQSQMSYPSSYEEWDLAGGEAGTGMTYAEYISQKAEKPATAAQFTVAGYASRIEQAEPTFKSLESTVAGYNPIQFMAEIASPFVGLQSKTVQQYMQASRNFINAVLRRESGAVISESEFDNARKQYLPQPGDTPEVLRMKEANRNNVLQGYIKSSGPAYSSLSSAGGENTIYDVGKEVGVDEDTINEMKKAYEGIPGVDAEEEVRQILLEKKNQ